MKSLRIWLEDNKLDGFIIPCEENHAEEQYCSKALLWLTGFSGSTGTAIVLQEKATIFVDGRYVLQAKREINTEFFEIENIIEEPLQEWITKNLQKSQKLGFDPWQHTINQAAILRKATQKVQAELTPVEKNPINQMRSQKPIISNDKITVHPIQFSGESSEQKLKRLKNEIQKHNATHLILTDPCSIAWTFNIRSPDTLHTPVPQAFAIIPTDKKPLLFIDTKKLATKTKVYLNDLSQLYSMESFIKQLSYVAGLECTISIDPRLIAEKLLTTILDRGGGVIRMRDPTLLFRAIKNSTERQGFRSAHQRDGIAITYFLKWIDSQKSGDISEISAAQKLQEYRFQAGEKTKVPYKGEAFGTIAAMGPNAAMIHYRPSRKTNRISHQGEIFLIDSGGQYEDGTTDITRTVAIGKPDKEIKRHFTLVLKGLIAISQLRFPAGTRGCDIDGLARQALWANGLDYAHGTGHGVGSFLAVHEGPQGISKHSTEKLQEGMILSNEPGYYKEGHYGIRCENLILVCPLEDIPGGDTLMHSFETLTLAPFDQQLIEASLLTEEERFWLNQYHKRVRETLSPWLEPSVSEWLYKTTCEIV